MSGSFVNLLNLHLRSRYFYDLTKKQIAQYQVVEPQQFFFLEEEKGRLATTATTFLLLLLPLPLSPSPAVVVRRQIISQRTQSITSPSLLAKMYQGPRHSGKSLVQGLSLINA